MFTADAAFDVVPDWVALIDADCIIRRANRAMAAAFGLEPDDLAGRKCYEVVHGTTCPIVDCPHVRLVNDSGKPTSERIELPGRGLFDVTCSPLRDADGALVGSVHLAQDASLRVRAEEESRESANYLQQLLDAIPTPVFHKDADGVYVAVNRAFADAVGRGREGILGKTSFDVYPADMAGDYQLHDAHLLAHGRTDVRVAEELYADGERRLVELHRSVYADLDGRPAGIVGVEFDVTEREQREAALRRAEASLGRAQQMGRVGSWEWDIITGELSWSDELYRIWGTEPGSALDVDQILAMIHPDDRDRSRMLLDGRMAEVDLDVVGFRIVRPDGEIRHVQQTLDVEKDEAGTAVRAFGVVQDVSDVAEARERLLEREALVRGLFDTMPSGCGVYEVRGTGRFGGDYIVKDLNRAGLAIEGRRKEDAVGKSLKDLRPDVDGYGLVDVFWRVWRTGDAEHYQVRIDADGQSASWYDNYVFRLATGEIVAIYNDVTATKRAEEALRASEAEMHAVFDLVGIPMLVMDTRGGFKRWNRAFQKALGYPAEELQGMTMRDITPPGERPEMLRRLSVALAGEGSSYRVERRLVAKDGSLPWFDLSVTPVIGAGGDVVAMIAAGTDITDARRAKNALVAREEQVRAALGETVAAMGAIVALRDPYTAGHELRVAALVEAIATDMGLMPEAVAGLRHAASVHDVGKVAVPAEIMTMPRRLSEWEYSLVQTHVEVGHEVLASIGFEQPVAEMVLQHHERLDGSGYPRGLRDGEIMPAARILAVADVVEAMASYRPYRSALGVGAALEEIQRGAGSLYDESVVASCLRVLRDGIVDLSEPEA